jgi:hypothetical protein
MRLALVFYHLPLLCVPSVSPQARFVIDWISGVIPDLRPSPSFGFILVHLLAPDPGQIDLSGCRAAYQTKEKQ